MSLTSVKNFKEKNVSKMFLKHKSKKLGIPGVEYKQLDDELMCLVPKDEFVMKVILKNSDIDIKENETFEEYLYRSQKPIGIKDKIIINGTEINSSELVKGIHKEDIKGEVVLLSSNILEERTLKFKFGIYVEEIDFRYSSTDENGNNVYESINCPMKITYTMKSSKSINFSFKLGILKSIEDKIFACEFILALYEKEVIIEDVIKCKCENNINLEVMRNELIFCKKIQKLQNIIGCEFKYNYIFEDREYLEKLYVSLIQKDVNKTYLKDFTLTFGRETDIAELKKMIGNSYGLCFEETTQLETSYREVRIYTACFLADGKVLNVEEEEDKILVKFIPLEKELLLIERDFVDISEMQSLCKEINKDFGAFYKKIMVEKKDQSVVIGDGVIENRD
ncbi:MAG: hypothetical protein ACRC30_06835 [Clostridium sp.]